MDTALNFPCKKLLNWHFCVNLEYG